MFINSVCSCGNDACREFGIEPVCERCYREAVKFDTIEDEIGEFPEDVDYPDFDVDYDTVLDSPLQDCFYAEFESPDYYE